VTPPSILWLGGAPCSGKSTVAAALARRFGLRVLALDAMVEARALRTTTPRTEALAQLAVRLADPTWPSWFLQDAPTLAREELRLLNEVFDLALDTIEGLPPGPPVLAEGAAALPACVAAWAAASDGIGRSERVLRAAWLVPAASFHASCYEERMWARALVARTDDPERAYRNWRGRDMLVARFVRREASRRGLHVLEVAGRAPTATAPRDVLTWVAGALGLAEAGT
jgi:hypothetical protein